MQTVTTIGLDIAKSVFQVHGIDAQGKVVIRRQLRRRLCPRVLREASAVSRWHRGLCFITSLVARAASARAHGTPDAGGVREALRQATEERCN